MLLNTKQHDFGQYSGKEAKDSHHGQLKITTSETVRKTWDMAVSSLAEMIVCDIYQFSFIIIII